MLSVPSRAYDNRFLSSIEGCRGNIYKLGRLLLHAWCNVVDKEGKAHDRYCFLFKSRILVTKVRKISENRSVFILQNIVKLPLCNIELKADEKQIHLSLKAPEANSFLPIDIKPHGPEAHLTWFNEISSHINQDVTLQEHNADDLKVDASQIASESELILHLPQRAEAHDPNLSVRPSDVAENYFLSKETKERLQHEQQELLKLEQEAIELYKKQQSSKSVSSKTESVEITSSQVKSSSEVRKVVSPPPPPQAQVKEVTPVKVVSSPPPPKEITPAKVATPPPQPQVVTSPVKEVAPPPQPRAVASPAKEVTPSQSEPVKAPSPIKEVRKEVPPSASHSKEVEALVATEIRESLTETRSTVVESGQSSEIREEIVVTEESSLEGKQVVALEREPSPCSIPKIQVYRPVECENPVVTKHKPIELKDIVGYSESLRDGDTAPAGGSPGRQQGYSANITDHASLTIWNNRLANIAGDRSGANQHLQQSGPPPPPIPPNFTRMPGFFQPLPLIAYETTIEILIVKARPPSPPPPPPPTIKRVLVHTESLEQKTQNFFEGIYDAASSDTSLRNAKQKIRSIKSTVLKSKDSTNYAQDTVQKAKARDFLHIFTPPVKKRPIYEIVEEPVNIFELEGDYTESIADDFREPSADFEARGQSVGGMDDYYSGYSRASTRRYESKLSRPTDRTHRSGVVNMHICIDGLVEAIL